MKLLIDIPDDMYTHVSTSDAYVLDDTDWILLENAIANGTPLDGLANGEVIQKMFPDGKITEESYAVFAHIEECDHPFDKAWWNRKWGE